MFLGYNLSTYQTDDPNLYGQLVKEVIEQTQLWAKEFQFSDEQKQQTLVLSRISASTKTEKEKFTVHLLVPLDEAHPSFIAVWEGLLDSTLIENYSLRLERAGI